MAGSAIAFVLGKQGSGKTTRVCAVIEEQLARWRFASMLQFHFSPIQVHSNRFNHLAVDDRGCLVLISGISDGRVATRLDTFRGRHVIELPHSGYIPASLHGQFQALGIQAEIFHLELPETTWRGIGGETGAITSPDYFMANGRLLVPRIDCDYAADTARIRESIARSGIPHQRFKEPEALVAGIKDFLLQRRRREPPGPAA